MLDDHGWHVRHALDFSTDADAYRDYITGSRGEFTVAKEQNVRLRTGWFSDRSATYLAAGRPVISQETGFSNVLPTGEGLFGFDSTDEIVDAIDRINSDYARHSRAAEEIAREYFSHDVVLPRLLEEVGVEVTSGRGYPVSAPHAVGAVPARALARRRSRGARRGSSRATEQAVARAPRAGRRGSRALAGRARRQHRGRRRTTTWPSPACAWKACWQTPNTPPSS